MFVCGVKPDVDSSDESDEDVMDILMVFEIILVEIHIFFIWTNVFCIINICVSEKDLFLIR